jgi:hypothetical protein
MMEKRSCKFSRPYHNSIDVLRLSCDKRLRLVIDPAALQMVLMVLTGWLDRRERHAVAYLIEENRLLRWRRSGRRSRLQAMSRHIRGWRDHRL